MVGARDHATPPSADSTASRTEATGRTRRRAADSPRRQHLGGCADFLDEAERLVTMD